MTADHHPAEKCWGITMVSMHVSDELGCWMNLFDGRHCRVEFGRCKHRLRDGLRSHKLWIENGVQRWTRCKLLG